MSAVVDSSRQTTPVRVKDGQQRRMNGGVDGEGGGRCRSKLETKDKKTKQKRQYQKVKTVKKENEMKIKGQYLLQLVV